MSRTTLPGDLHYPDELVDELAKELTDAIACSLNDKGRRKTDKCAKGLLGMILKKATIKIGNRIIKG